MQTQNWSNEMKRQEEARSRAQQSGRLGEAQFAQHDYQEALARRLSRQAERSALQARVAIARMLI